ncbi:MAG: geranylgeranylglyceryl/heptaprenylglyceryl phosphate synthase [Bacteroidetes bacterium]|nr:geranylgeranylglyceryl/heptaprenylglyceryl phosphate synthase [Bacteroidota bacterium]
MSILSFIEERSLLGKKLFAVLLDPDKYDEPHLSDTLKKCEEAEVDLLLAGGSLLMHHRLDAFVNQVKEESCLPLVLFPGDLTQISPQADAILFLSLISGRNPEMLIGRHVLAAPRLKETSLEIIPTGYMLIGNDARTTAHYMSNTFPIPEDKEDVAMCTAMAGNMLGMRLIYMDAGSGARHTVSPGMITRVKQHITVPLVIGGGIRTAGTAFELAKAGADVLVAGNALENDNGLISQLAKAIHSV